MNCKYDKNNLFDSQNYESKTNQVKDSKNL